MVMAEFQNLVNEAKREVPEITPEDLKSMQDSGEDVTVIDVRSRGQCQGRNPRRSEHSAWLIGA